MRELYSSKKPCTYVSSRSGVIDKIWMLLELDYSLLQSFTLEPIDPPDVNSHSRGYSLENINGKRTGVSPIPVVLP